MALRESHAYTVVDVFTTEPLAGNPLAVFPDASECDAVTMQRIARELNLAETAARDSEKADAEPPKDWSRKLEDSSRAFRRSDTPALSRFPRLDGYPARLRIAQSRCLKSSIEIHSRSLDAADVPLTAITAGPAVALG